MWQRLLALLSSLGPKHLAEQDLDDEIRFHVETRAEELVRTGVEPSEALRRARLEFGGLVRVKEDCRDARGGRYARDLGADIRSAWRQASNDRGLTVTIVATVALAIGLTGAVFAVVDAIVLHPLPYRDHERVVVLWATNPRVGMGIVQARRTQHSIAAGEFAAWRDQSGVFDALAAVAIGNGSHLGAESILRLADVDPHAEPAVVANVSDNFFDVVGVPPQTGRPFLSRSRRGRDREVILQDSYRHKRFGALGALLGKTFRIDSGTQWEQELRLVGVMPPGFAVLSGGVDYLLPFDDFDEYAARAPDGRYFTAMGRLKSGLSLEDAQHRADTFSRTLAQRHPGTGAGWRVELVPAAEDATGESRPFLLALLAAVLVLLLVLGVNTATLLVLKAVVRGREIAVRSAMGASAGRLLRQFVTESTTFAIAGSLLGLLMIHLLLSWLRLALPNPKTWGGSFLQADALRVGWPVVVFAVGASLFVGGAFGVLPAWYASRTNPVEGLKDAAPGMIGAVRRRRLGGGLLAAQLVLAAVLVIGAGLLLRSTLALFRYGPGFDYTSRLVIGARAGDQQIADRLVAAGHSRERARRIVDEGTSEYWGERDRFRSELTGRVASLPGVLGVTTASDMPMSGSYWLASFRAEPEHMSSAGECTEGLFTSVDANYFRELSIPLLAGRAFGSSDRSSAPVVVVSEMVAKRCWPGRSPIGKRLQSMHHPEKTWFTVVGVVGDTRVDGMDKPAVPHVYEPWSQNRWWWGSVSYVLRTHGDPLSMVPVFRSQMSALDKGAYVLRLHRLGDLVRDSAWRMNAAALLATGLATVSLLLAAIGIFGVLSHAVRDRTREIGLRLALGAGARHVGAFVVRHVLTAVVVGVVAGLALSSAVVSSLRALLFGVDPLDPLTFAAAGLVLGCTALAAAAVPLRRALRLEPARALREE